MVCDLLLWTNASNSTYILAVGSAWESSHLELVVVNHKDCHNEFLNHNIGAKVIIIQSEVFFPFRTVTCVFLVLFTIDSRTINMLHIKYCSHRYQISS